MKKLWILTLLSASTAFGQTNRPLTDLPVSTTASLNYHFVGDDGSLVKRFTGSALEAAMTNPTNQLSIVLRQLIASKQTTNANLDGWSSIATSSKQNVLGYTPATNSYSGITNSLGFAPATNLAISIGVGQITNAGNASFSNSTAWVLFPTNSGSDGQVVSLTGNKTKWITGGVGDVLSSGQNNFSASNHFTDIGLSGTLYVQQLVATNTALNGNGITNIQITNIVSAPLTFGSATNSLILNGEMWKLTLSGNGSLTNTVGTGYATMSITNSAATTSTFYITNSTWRAVGSGTTNVAPSGALGIPAGKIGLITVDNRPGYTIYACAVQVP